MAADEVFVLDDRVFREWRNRMRREGADVTALDLAQAAFDDLRAAPGLAARAALARDSLLIFETNIACWFAVRPGADDEPLEVACVFVMPGESRLVRYVPVPSAE